MVLQKRLDYGFNGYQVPPIPRATRSARRRGSFKKKHEENQMCAFDLLAIVAGKLLLDKESAPSSSDTSADEDQRAVINSAVKNEWQDEEKSLKVEACDQGSADKNIYVSDLSHVHRQGCSSKESLVTQNDLNLGLASALAKPDCAARSNVEKFGNGQSKSEIGTFASKVEGGPSEYIEFGDCKLEAETKRAVKDEPHKSGMVQSSTVANICSLEDPVVLDAKPPALVSSDSSAKVPPCGNPNSSYPTNQDDVNVVSRDDDENSSGCTHPITTKKFFRPAPRIGDRRIRKILASKYWKVAPRLKDATVSNSVKLRIKSFSVPELLIEIPESSTVGSLKRTVMEAVTAILGSGLRVGVLLQGKKVREDNKTLQQTGISRNNQLDALGFCLEPNPSQITPSLCPGDSPFFLQCDTPQPILRYPHTTGVVHQGICAVPEPHANNLGNYIESDHDSAPSPTDTSMDKSTNSKALVAVPAMNVEALAVVPAHRKSKRSEIAQRRIRRPFSVTEVEALVHAVEKLGTGRWRDVKLRAFDNAKHRTYVDLKDKWKTLVHTARISPQQRRGEPVPQELLDRVLAAHAYWSQQQAKQQFKHQQAETCLLL